MTNRVDAKLTAAEDGVHPTEIAALCLLRRRGTANDRDEAFDLIHDEFLGRGSVDPLVAAAFISLLADPNPGTRALVGTKLAFFFNLSGLEACEASDDPNEHYRAVRLACSRFPRALGIIAGLASGKLVEALTELPAGGEHVARTATEGNMGQLEPAGGQIVSLALPARTVAALRSQAAIRGQTLEAFLQQLAENTLGWNAIAPGAPIAANVSDEEPQVEPQSEFNWNESVYQARKAAKEYGE